MLWSAGAKPRILVPAGLWERLDARQRDTLLLHELAHLRRRDHWVRWIELLATALYWWNPVCWWARHELREAEEQCCDAWVLWAMPGSFRDYASALLEAVDFVSIRPSVPLLASGMGQFGHLKRRLTMLKQGNVARALTLDRFRRRLRRGSDSALDRADSGGGLQTANDLRKARDNGRRARGRLEPVDHPGRRREADRIEFQRSTTGAAARGSIGSGACNASRSGEDRHRSSPADAWLRVSPGCGARVSRP